MQRQKQAATVSEQLSRHFSQLHLKEISKSLIYVPNHQITWCIVPKVHFLYIDFLLRIKKFINWVPLITIKSKQ